MKKLRKWMTLFLALTLSCAFLLSACGKNDDNGDGGELTVTIEKTPTLTYFGDNEEAAQLQKDTLVISYAKEHTVTAKVAEGGIELSEPESKTEGEVKRDTYTVTATAVGEYTIDLSEGETKVDSFSSKVASPYPEDPEFPTTSISTSMAFEPSVGYVHDPVIVEDDGTFYVFSTDNAGGDYGYQVRKSTDLVHWEKLAASAIPDCGKEDSSAKALYQAGTAELQEVYELLKSHSQWGENYVLWAPEVTKAADGGWWLYGCWTARFGCGTSVLFLCHADKVEGPYSYVDTLIFSKDNWAYDSTLKTKAPNAIDPNVIYDEDGKMYLNYGSFSGGIWQLELDPQTGLRKDGNNGVDKQSGTLTYTERYGKQIISSERMEGPTMNYHKDVAIYSGDPAAYDESKVTYEDRYYLMASADSLSADYNMRSYSASAPTGTFDSLLAEQGLGNRVSGSFSWRTNANDTRPNFDFFAPGHNDMITTSTGANLIAYHNRTGFGGGNHFLFVSSYAFNSRGDLVMNANRYAGEVERKVFDWEILSVSNGKYAYAYVTDSAYAKSYNGGYAKEDMTLAENNVVKIGTSSVGSWYLYGDNWVYLNITSGDLQGKFYGVVMPAYIEGVRAGGLTMSFISEDGTKTLYMNSLVGL